MSKRDEILSYCKYYKGEKENPFTTYYGRMFWEYEANFVHKFESGFFKDSPIDEALSDYMIGALNTCRTCTILWITEIFTVKNISSTKSAQ